MQFFHPGNGLEMGRTVWNSGKQVYHKSRDLPRWRSAMLARRSSSLFTLLVLLILPAHAKDKKKIPLPDYVLRARTVLVVVDPDAGISPLNPNENRIAQDDVEKALMSWGRFSPVMDAQTADLVITVRRGHGKVVNPTIGGVPNDRPVILQPSDGGIRIGGQQGRPSPVSDPGANEPQQTGPYPRTEVGPSEDTFAVYRGGVEYPLDSSPVWRYSAKDALNSPNVPAVAQFRKLVEEAEKQQQRRQKP
jgi:hypothetical protein